MARARMRATAWGYKYPNPQLHEYTIPPAITPSTTVRSLSAGDSGLSKEVQEPCLPSGRFVPLGAQFGDRSQRLRLSFPVCLILRNTTNSRAGSHEGDPPIPGLACPARAKRGSARRSEMKAGAARLPSAVGQGISSQELSISYSSSMRSWNGGRISGIGFKCHYQAAHPRGTHSPVIAGCSVFY